MDNPSSAKQMPSHVQPLVAKHEQKPVLKRLDEMVQEPGPPLNQLPNPEASHPQVQTNLAATPPKPAVQQHPANIDFKQGEGDAESAQSSSSHESSDSSSSDESDTSDSSDSSSSDNSDSDSSDSSDSDDNSTENTPTTKPKEVASGSPDAVQTSPVEKPVVKQVQAVDEDDVDTEPLRTKHEKDSDSIPIPIVDVQITPEHKLLPVGKITAVMEKAIIIESEGDHQPKHPTPRDIENAEALDAETVLCFKDRTVLGRVFETFGPVTSPFYIVRFNSKDEIIALKHAHVDMPVFYVEQMSLVVHAANVRGKGYDSSNIHDEELDANHVDFSDDEAESAAKAKKKRQNREPTDHSNQARSARGRAPRGGPAKRGRGFGRGDTHSAPNHGRISHTSSGFRNTRGGRGGMHGAWGPTHTPPPAQFSAQPSGMNMGFYNGMMPMQQAAFYGAPTFPTANFTSPSWLMSRNMTSQGTPPANMQQASNMQTPGLQTPPMPHMAGMANLPGAMPGIGNITPSPIGGMFAPNMHTIHVNGGRGGQAHGAQNDAATQGYNPAFANAQMYAGQQGDFSQMYAQPPLMGGQNAPGMMNMYGGGAPHPHPASSPRRHSGERDGV